MRSRCFDVARGLVAGGSFGAASRRGVAIAAGQRPGWIATGQRPDWIAQTMQQRFMGGHGEQKIPKEVKVKVEGEDKTVKVKVEPLPEPAARGGPNEVPDLRDYAVGVERLEMEVGIDRLIEPPEGLVGHFGTAENPFVVESFADERIVGCTGKAYPEDHEILWLNLKKGEVTVCPYCDQHYLLADVKMEIEEEEEEEKMKIKE